MDVLDVAAQVERRLTRATWDTSRLETTPPAAELATFALELAGKKREARKAGRFGQVLVRFALAACVALAGAAAACEKPDASPEATATAIARLPDAGGAEAALTASPRASPARFTNLLLVDAGSDAQPWAVLVPRGDTTPVLVDRARAGLDQVGSVYNLAAQPVSVGTRDGTAQFLDPLTPAEPTGAVDQAPAVATVTAPWSEDERFLASARAIAGQPVVLDAAYNAASAVAAGGTHTYLNGVVLRSEPDKPVLAVIDQALLQSGRPTRPEDIVYVAIRDAERSLYEPGTVVNLRDVVMEQQQTDVDGQPTTVYIPNAALEGARVEPTGHVDLQSLLTPRLQRVDQDLSAQVQEVAASGTPAAAQPTATAQARPVQPAVGGNTFRGPSLIDDFLIWMWLSNSGFFRGPSVVINNPPSAPSRGGDVYYSPAPSTTTSSPTTVSSQQAAARSTALQAARSAVSGQAAGTGGGVAATNKSAADASARVSAATAKSAAAAGAVSSSSAGKSITSAPRSSSSSASRSTGSVSAGARGGSASSGSGGSVSSSGGGFGGKGIGGASSS